MAKKQRGFAQKVGGKKGKEITQVKFVRSIQSKKTGHWRFNEQMISLEKGETLDAALKRLAAEATVQEMTPVLEPVDAPTVEEDNKGTDEPGEETGETTPGEEKQDTAEPEKGEEQEAETSGD